MRFGSNRRFALGGVVAPLSYSAVLLSVLCAPAGEHLPGTRTAIELIAAASARSHPQLAAVLYDPQKYRPLQHWIVRAPDGSFDASRFHQVFGKMASLREDRPGRDVSMPLPRAAQTVSTETRSPDPLSREAKSEPLPRRLFFYHLPKTGGSTIIKAIVGKYGPETIRRPRKIRTPLTDILYRVKCRSLIEDPSGADGSYHIASHFASLSCIRGHELEFHKATFWRHPADWCLSYYNWRISRDRPRLRRVYRFWDFVRSLPRNPMTQDFLLYCGDMPGWRYFLLSDRRKFEAALTLTRHFDVFADVSKVNAFLQEVGLADTGAPKNHNVIADEQKQLRSLDERERAELARCNPVDFYLYRISQGVEQSKVVAEAREQLSDTFSLDDLFRHLVRPYYRAKVKFIAFV